MSDGSNKIVVVKISYGIVAQMMTKVFTVDNFFERQRQLKIRPDPSCSFPLKIV